MQQAKLDIAFAFTNYAGNGGIASTIPHLRRWWAVQQKFLMNDPRIGRVADLGEEMVSDTPITMVRNKCLRFARDQGFDILVFIDSDNVPDLYLGHIQAAVPFLDTAFDFTYKRLMNGIPTVIAAPYCGPPPHPVRGGEENVYVFHWQNYESLEHTDGPHEGLQLIGYQRHEAALMSGIQPAAALPTGVCMIALKILEVLPAPWFRYEWNDEHEDQKASTEDVFFTRNADMIGVEKYGTSIVFCQWSSWAGHYKQKMVGKPTILRVDQVSKIYTEAVRRNFESGDKLEYLGFKPDGTIDGHPLQNVQPPYPEEHAIRPAVVAGRYTENDDTLLSEDDRQCMANLLETMFGRRGAGGRKLVYVGTPEPGLIGLMAAKGTVYVMVEKDEERLPYALEVLGGREDVKFVLLDEDTDESIWDGNDAALVFVHESYAHPIILQSAVRLLKRNGLLCGTGDTGDAFQGTPIGNYQDSELWGITRKDYEEAIEANGHATEA